MPVETVTADTTAAIPHKATGQRLLSRSLAEGAGSFLLVLAGLGVTMFNAQAGLGSAMAFGLALIAAYLAFGNVSIGHFNPAVTIGSAIAGRSRWSSVLPYLVAQLIGALLAGVMLWAMLIGHPQIPETSALFSVAANGFNDHSANAFPLTAVLLAEVVGTAAFVAVFLGSTGARANRASSPFAIGFAYAVLLTFLIPLSNGSLNPARSTVTALFAESWALSQLWLFWVAPVLGAVIAGLIYRSVDLFGAMPLSSKEPDDAALAVERDVEANTTVATPAAGTHAGNGTETGTGAETGAGADAGTGTDAGAGADAGTGAHRARSENVGPDADAAADADAKSFFDGPAEPESRK